MRKLIYKLCLLYVIARFLRRLRDDLAKLGLFAFDFAEQINLKEIVVESATRSFDKVLYGEEKAEELKKKRAESAEYRKGRVTLYPYDRTRRPQPQSMTMFHGPAPFDHPTQFDFMFKTQEEAQAVLDKAGEILDSVGYVTVENVKKLINIEPNETDRQWGWPTLDESLILPNSRGFVLTLPRAPTLQRV